MKDKLAERLSHLPDRPGAYMMKSSEGEIIYVGKASSLRSRVRSYFQSGQAHPSKVAVMVTHVADVDWMVTDSEVEALMLECNLIKKHRPRYNVRLRDDKHYPYLCVTMSEPYPRAIVTRRSKRDGNRYFGPYTDARALRESLRLIRRVFRIRGCNKKLTGREADRPCLNLHLGRCDSPCSGAISREDYRETVHDICLFVEGRLDSISARIEAEMNEASERLEFERATRLRDQLLAIRKFAERQRMINTDQIDRDIISILSSNGSTYALLVFIRSGRVIGQEQFQLDGPDDEDSPGTAVAGFIKQYYRDAVYVPRELLVSHAPEDHLLLEDMLSVRRGSRVTISRPLRGEKKRLVEMAQQNARLLASREEDESAQHEESLASLAETLGLAQLPNRIEAFDISNTQGRLSVASMVVFEKGLPARREYRRFRIRTVDGPDDYASIREAVRRRFSAASANPKFSCSPDLVVIDGGPGQLSAALEGLVEGSGECDLDHRGDIVFISLAKRFEEVYLPGKDEPLVLARSSPGLRLLQRVRDEAHRFALSYHQNLRRKSATKSVLEDIPGIGDQRRKALIKRFGSLKGVRAASLEEIQSTPGMNRKTATVLYQALRPDE